MGKRLVETLKKIWMNKHIKKYSISLFIREIQIKITITTTTHPLDELNSKRLTIPSVNKDEKSGISYTHLFRNVK